MERLTSRQTIRHADGTAHLETYCHGHRYGPAAFPNKYGTSDPQEYKDYCEMVDRLAAYEDTGLEPSQLNELQNEAFDLGYQACLHDREGLSWSGSKELQGYQSIGTVEEFRVMNAAEQEQCGFECEN